jgi:phosphatidylinositol-3-phosphatase
VKRRNKVRAVVYALGIICALQARPSLAQGDGAKTHIQTVFVILMENHNWTGDNSGAAFGAPDIKGSPLAPYVNDTLLPMASHAEQYFNPPGNHPSLPNYLWLEAGTNFGILKDILPKQAHLRTDAHFVKLLENAGITWKAYAEPDFGNPDFTDCPLDFSELDVNHLPFVYFEDITNKLDSNSAECIEHVRPYDQLATDLAAGTVAQYNFITPNLCHDGHEGVSPCDPSESSDNTLRGDAWLSREVPKLLDSKEYNNGGALFIIWDEAEDGGAFSDGPVGMIVLSPFAKGNGFENFIHYTHGSTLRTFQEIFGVSPLLGDAANETDLSDLFAVFP